MSRTRAPRNIHLYSLNFRKISTDRYKTNGRKPLTDEQKKSFHFSSCRIVIKIGSKSSLWPHEPEPSPQPGQAWLPWPQRVPLSLQVTFGHLPISVFPGAEETGPPPNTKCQFFPYCCLLLFVWKTGHKERDFICRFPNRMATKARGEPSGK